MNVGFPTLNTGYGGEPTRGNLFAYAKAIADSRRQLPRSGDDQERPRRTDRYNRLRRSLKWARSRRESKSTQARFDPSRSRDAGDEWRRNRISAENDGSRSSHHSLHDVQRKRRKLFDVCYWHRRSAFQAGGKEGPPRGHRAAA